MGTNNLSINASPMRGATGEVTEVAAVFSNITARKAVEGALQAAETARAMAEAAHQRSAFLADASVVLATLLEDERPLQSVADLAVPYFADCCMVDIFDEKQSIHQWAIAHCDPTKRELLRQINPRSPKTAVDLEGRSCLLQYGQAEMMPTLTDANLTAIAQDAEQLRLLRELNLQSWIVVPLVARDRTLGVISFAMADSGRRYEQADLTLAEDLARRVAIALDNARRYQAMQQAKQEAETANQVKDQFLAVVSHELRTPLNSILGWVQLLRSRQMNEATVARALETIERNARSQNQLIEDLLDVSRLIRGKISLHRRPIRFRSVIEAALEVTHLSALAKNIQITTDLDESADAILADAERLQQVIWNLLSNAIKFTPEGGAIEIQLRGSTDQAQLQVRDTGMGIGADFLPYIFEYFQQDDGTTTRSHSGLGLGLAIAHNIVKLHGGTMQADSPGTGLGATFTVNLPRLMDLDQGSGDGVVTLTERSSIPFGKLFLQDLTVLVVDDEVDTREFLTFSLETVGATVIAVASAYDALTVIEQQPIDILISDLAMPVEDGYSLLRQLQELEERNLAVPPAIALTAFAGETYCRQAFETGFQAYLSKPIEMSELVKVILALVRN